MLAREQALDAGDACQSSKPPPRIVGSQVGIAGTLGSMAILVYCSAFQSLNVSISRASEQETSLLLASANLCGMPECMPWSDCMDSNRAIMDCMQTHVLQLLTLLGILTACRLPNPR
jgi:hypothetical protein